jgi:hypothetical protein
VVLAVAPELAGPAFIELRYHVNVVVQGVHVDQKTRRVQFFHWNAGQRAIVFFHD